MITREQSIQFKANSAYVRNSSHMTLNEAEAYNMGYMDGAHEADRSMINIFTLWVNHNNIFSGKEEEIIRDFKSYIGMKQDDIAV